MTNPEQCEITINFDSDKLDLIKIAAEMCDQPVSDFVIDAALDKAVKTILTDKVAFISGDAYRVVCDTLLQLER